VIRPATAFLVAAVLASGPAAAEESGIAALAAKAIAQEPAKRLFGAQQQPANLKARAIGYYARGCLSGAANLPIDGPAWQVMRLSRNRNWGHPQLVALVERLAEEARANDGWNGLLVGDISQPRGGPMTSGHASHQIGLDADIWLTPMPDRILTREERENMSARLVVKDHKQMDYGVWTEAHARLIKRAAQYPQVARIFVHPPIKVELCRWATGDRSWLAKVRPYYGHNYHFHIRIKCPAGQPGCRDQWEPRPADGTGCGKELAWWMSDEPWRPKKPIPNAPPPKQLKLADLPAECRAVLTAQ
jgi:penicillin-insensitive murein endopeptidase